MAETHENQQLEVKQKVVDKVERMEVVELPVAAKLLVTKKAFLKSIYGSPLFGPILKSLSPGGDSYL